MSVRWATRGMLSGLYADTAGSVRPDRRCDPPDQLIGEFNHVATTSHTLIKPRPGHTHPRSDARLVGHLPPSRTRQGSGQHLADLGHAITQSAIRAVAKSPDLGAPVSVGDHRSRHAAPSGPPIVGNRMAPSSWLIMVLSAWHAITGRSADRAPDSFTWAESACRPARGRVSAGPTARSRTARFKYLISYVVYLIYVLSAS